MPNEHAAQASDDATRTLVVHLGGIGDFLLTCPTLRHLSGVELLGCADRLELAVAGGLAQAAYDTGRVDFQSLFATPTERLRRFLGGFQRCILWIRDDGILQRNVEDCGVADVQAFPGLPPRDWRRHASEYYLECLGIAGADPLRLAIEPLSTVHDVVIHPGSGGEHKNWPIECFAELASGLEARGRRVTWCMGPAEEGVDVVPTLQRASLVDLARELASARLYIGNDSGITHLAAAVGCPTIAIFGPTDPAVWGPRGTHVTALRGTPFPQPTKVLARTSGAYCGAHKAPDGA
ncbi:MAG: hypothetical protein GWP08_00010 [Nitrospiraceae bacterium]|nr:hypothetical protein [Nitrospiraceae bacterium]